MFRYIYESEFDLCIDRYLDYLAGLKGTIDDDLYTFLSDSGRYDLSKTSLHDSWLRRLSLNSFELAERRMTQNLHLELLGPYHDRIFHLHYTDILGYSISQRPRRRPGHPDLLMHEFRVGEQGEFEHAIEFDDGLAIVVACRSMRLEEVMLVVEAETESSPDA